MATPLTCSFGCAFSDRIEALLDGRVAADGIDLQISLCQPQALFRDVLRDQTYDVAEMSLGSHIVSVGSGRDDYVALPIFLSRAFRHSNIYIRGDRISQPKDLADATIGVIDYEQTAGIWVRGLLADEYRIDRRGLKWVAGGLNAPAAEGRRPLPNGLPIHRTDDTLSDLLERGELDAVISPLAPDCFVERRRHVRRLFENPMSAELDYYVRTGIFPIMHCVVVRRRLIDRHPDLPRALFTAFDAARRLAIVDLDLRDYPKIATPWIGDHRRAVNQCIGKEAWTYGVGRNRNSIEAILRYTAEDGLTEKRLTIEEVFAGAAG